MTHKLPAWVPTWKAWTMAIRLAVPAYGVATVVPAFEVWRGCFLGIILSFTDAQGGLLGLGVSLLFLLLALLWFLLWSAAYALLLRLLWTAPPKHLRLPPLPTLVNRDFGILVTAVLPVAIAYLAHVGLTVGLRQHLPTFSAFKLNYETVLLASFWLWFVAAVFLYHSYYQIRARVRQRNRQRSTC